MKYSIPVKHSSENVLKTYELNATYSYPKAPKIPLPPSVTSRDSSVLIGESESTFTDYDQFLEILTLRLRKIMLAGQKNRLYSLTIQLGNFDESEIPLLGNAPSIAMDNPSQFTKKLIHGGVIRVTAGLT